MKFFILFAVLGLCQAGGFPISNYAIETHGPDRSFSLVHKSNAIAAVAPKMIIDAPKMIVADPVARGYLANDWGWAGKGMAIAAPTAFDSALAFAPKTLAIAGYAPSVSTSYVSRTIHDPAYAIAAKPMIASLDARCVGCGISPLTIGKSMLEEKLIRDKLVENEFAKRAFAEKAWVENKMVAEKMMMDKVLAERAILGASLTTPVVVGKSMLEEKLIRDKLVENEFAKRAFAEKAWLEDKMIENKIINDKILAEKALMSGSMVAPLSTLTDKWMGKAALAMSPMALRSDVWLGDKVLAAPLGTKTMLIKK